MNEGLWRLLEREWVDTYFLNRLIGVGGFGGVFAAEQWIEKRRIRNVAIKLISPNADLIDQQLNELVTAANLHHPNVVRTDHAGSTALRDAKYLYLVMEIAEGDLNSRLKSGPLFPAEATELIEQIGSALVFLRERGLTHRDLKPANILRAGGVWKLSDLGTIRHSSGGATAMTKVVRGTPKYLPPESFKGVVSPAWDVWSLGVLLFEALTGAFPFTGPTDEALFRTIIEDDPTGPSINVQPFAEIVRGCLVKDHHARWSAEQVLAELKSFISRRAEDERKARLAAERRAEQERIAREERLAELQAQLLEAARREELITRQAAEREAGVRKVEEERTAREAVAHKAVQERLAGLEAQLLEAARKGERITRQAAEREAAVRNAEEERTAREAAVRKAEQERLAELEAQLLEAARKEEERYTREVEERRLAREIADAARRNPREYSETNIERWRSSGEPEAWVRAHLTGWNHEDWLAILASLRKSQYWPMNEDAIGHHLETLLAKVRTEEKDRIARETGVRKAEQERLTHEAAARRAEEERLVREATLRREREAEKESLSSEAAARQARVEQLTRERDAIIAERANLERQLATHQAESDRLAGELAQGERMTRMLLQTDFELMTEEKKAAVRSFLREVEEKEPGSQASELARAAREALESESNAELSRIMFDLMGMFSESEGTGATEGSRLEKGLSSVAHPHADPDGAARRNIEYRKALAQWEALPRLQRLLTKKPPLPPGMFG